jgi:hypothetical protein
MQNGDLDGLITKFEQLVRHTNYDVNQPLVLCIFTDALPHAMYEYIFKNIQPRDYEGWQEASIQQQKVFVHMKSRLEQFNPRKMHQQGPPTGRPTTTTRTNGGNPISQTSQILMQWIYHQEGLVSSSRRLRAREKLLPTTRRSKTRIHSTSRTKESPQMFQL